MYKIMFVDDDPLILKRLNHILDWESLGFQIIANASSGEKALALIQKLTPDVVITDINMPNMSGLQLVEKSKSLSDKIKFIMLTVNDSFGCAQQALNIGVYHYLLKPIEKDKLLHLIHTLISNFENSKKQNQYMSNLRDKAILSERMIKDKYLNWLVSGSQPLTDQQIIENFNFYNIPIQADKFEIISIHINKLDTQVSNKQRLLSLIETVIRSVENTLCDYKNCAIFSDSTYNINVLLGFSQEQSIIEQNTEVICQIIRDNLLFEMNLPVTIFYSRKYDGYQNIYRCYYETKYLIKYTQGIMDMGIISYDNFISISLPVSINFDDIRSKTLKYLRANEITSVRAFVYDTISRPFVSSASSNFEYLNIISIDFIMTGIMFLQENKTAIREVFHKYFNPINEISEISNPIERSNFIIHYYEDILNYISANKISSGKSMVKKCMELVEQNISNPSLSVKWLASQLYINENYLSRVFHKEAGIFLIKYINNQRLIKAKYYLDHDYNSMQAVSQMTGFSDPLYFSKCFKKKYGVAPSKYIKMVDK
ncbi:MAG TPA: DNA-binding response regulator [Lachnospiraceae bacterium]|nr:DNA-binding response regulator [Lachnospiraceae bacterium]